jgi:hypothetical protein
MKNFLKWGIYIAAANIILSLIGYFAGLSMKPEAQYLNIASMVASLVLLFLGVREKKSESPSDFTFGRGWVEGFLISLIAAVLVAVWMVLFLGVIAPDLADYIHSEALKNMMKNPPPQENMATARNMLDFFTSPQGLAISTIFMYTLGGMIVSLIISPIVKSIGGTPPPVENGQIG